MRYMFTVAPMLLLVLGLSACAQNDGSSADHAATAIDQSKLCQVDTWKPLTVANDCESGQKVLYRPGENGSAEDAALFAAANCDLRYSVAVTPGGTTCIYQPISSANALSSKQGTGSTDDTDTD